MVFIWVCENTNEFLLIFKKRCINIIKFNMMCYMYLLGYLHETQIKFRY